MKNIIVPTDFSDAAKNALEYAKHLTAPLNAKIKVVHVCYPDVVAMDAFATSIDIETLKTLSSSRLRQLVRTPERADSGGIIAENEHEELEQEVVIGFANTELQSLSKEADTQMLVMGTTGDGGVLNQLFGSVSSHVSRQADCPVWLIPPGASFGGINRIMYAGSFDQSDLPMIERVIHFSNIFGAHLHLVHVNEGQEEGKLTVRDFDQIIATAAPANELVVNTIESDSVWEGLQNYAADQQMDLMVILSRQRSFWENLWHKPHAKSIITHTKIPLVVMH